MPAVCSFGARPGEDIRHPCLRLVSSSFAVKIGVYMKAARAPSRSEPAQNYDFRPRATPRRARSGQVFAAL